MPGLLSNSAVLSIGMHGKGSKVYGAEDNLLVDYARCRRK